MPFFSIIIPIYKAEAYLRKCVDSVLCQTFQDFELILVDDGSPDGCPAICEAYAARDSRIRVIHKENGGVSSARNTGMRMAQGAYLLFLDSDDYYCEPKGLEIIREALERRAVDVLVFGVQCINAQTGAAYPRPFYPPELNEQETGRVLRSLLENNTLLCSFCEVAVRNDFLKTHKLYADESLIIAEDGEWTMRVMSCMPRYGFINDVIYCTPRGTADVFHGTRWDRMEAMCAFLRRYLERDYPTEEIRAAVLGLGAYHYTLCCAQAAAGERCTERRQLCRRLKELRIYWRYAVERKALLAARASRILGFRGTLFLLGRYMKR